ncbi:MAG: preprotein translocase subunit YajC [Cytophagaceae bacterium]|jgi:preprotein translocase subunit YajC|nr:preprotein translocase subunit YajC [Cytophagaceae bacterium]
MNVLFLQAAAESPNWMMQFGPLILLVVVFYFFLIRPQQKRAKDLRSYRESLKKGDNIIVAGGIYGRVYEIKENKVVVEISDNVRITVDKSAVMMDMTDVAKK